MKTYFGYIRVSTAKQSTHGVSLTEQKSAIERYAARGGLTVVEWFEERETAAKHGRPVFSRMLSALRKGKASGVVIHKIDRSARNLRDWADLGEMIDAGVEVHFAADALDLNSRGGRLSADIQAVVAADYIRNLREETRKGFYGRLKQGLYPLAAPIGYRDQGGGRAKTPDPHTAPLVRNAFELYATGRYSLRSLQSELRSRGLNNVRGGALSLNGLSTLLNNPFYCGIIRLRHSGETFKGIHEPIITAVLYERVQRLLKGKCGPKITRHDPLFRRLIRCSNCKRLLVAERQKGFVYYRCHTPRCPTRTLREDRAEDMLCALYVRIQLTNEEVAEAREYLEARHARGAEDHDRARSTVLLRLADARARLERATDGVLDGLLDRDSFERRKRVLLIEIARLEEQLATEHHSDAARVSEAVKIASSLLVSYRRGDQEEKRRIVDLTVQSFALNGRAAQVTLSEPFFTFANREATEPHVKLSQRLEALLQAEPTWLDLPRSVTPGVE